MSTMVPLPEIDMSSQTHTLHNYYEPEKFLQTEAAVRLVNRYRQRAMLVTEDFIVTHNTLNDSFIILDEAQNTTREQMKMFLTRFGQNSRMVVCGDPLQVDIPGGQRMSGLADAVEKLEGVEGFGTIRFTAADVVRHPIVGRIVEAYEGPSN